MDINMALVKAQIANVHMVLRGDTGHRYLESPWMDQDH